MTKIDELLLQAVAGRRTGEPLSPVDRAAVLAELIALVHDAARAGASEVPESKVVVQPQRPTAWRFRFVRREGLLEEIVAIPVDPKDLVA